LRPCLVGYINLLGTGERLPARLRMIGREDLLTRPEIAGPEEAIPTELAEEIEGSYLAWSMQHTMRDALAIAQSHRILGGSVHTIADLLADPVFGDAFLDAISADLAAAGALVSYNGRWGDNVNATTSDEEADLGGQSIFKANWVICTRSRNMGEDSSTKPASAWGRIAIPNALLKSYGECRSSSG